ncbi:lytic transglycosylase domain-containing protein [Burkholderia alba]|uniref:lytic transglycosylase domain-containing protein n=1 Tax=Burkholderia alba TaxID=2683677 RepID=UPI002B05C4DC|nr:transglycosylase SLT domain-containing protein [Burkholderia alba]
MQSQERSLIAGLPSKIGQVLVAALGLCGTARADCLDDAAAFHKVNISLVRAIARVESGMRADSINTNTNGTYDIGLMQINSIWLPTLARYGVHEQNLYDPCVNAYIGTWILAQNIRQFGPTWTAVGAYNAGDPDKRLAYARKVYGAIMTVADSSALPPPLPPSYSLPADTPAPTPTYNPFASLLSPAARPAGRPRAAPAVDPRAAATPAAPGSYNFGWTVSGADQAKPFQVFDDGAKVYLQFEDMKKVPAIFAETPAGRVLLYAAPQFPYLVIDRPERALIFQLGAYEARAVRGAVTMSAPANPPAGTARAGAAAVTPSAAQAGSAQRATRGATTDALWYATQSSTSSMARPAAAPATVAPPAAPVATSAPAPAKSPPSTDALWYISH